MGCGGMGWDGCMGWGGMGWDAVRCIRIHIHIRIRIRIHIHIHVHVHIQIHIQLPLGVGIVGSRRTHPDQGRHPTVHPISFSLCLRSLFLCVPTMATPAFEPGAEVQHEITTRMKETQDCEIQEVLDQLMPAARSLVTGTKHTMTVTTGKDGYIAQRINTENLYAIWELISTPLLTPGLTPESWRTHPLTHSRTNNPSHARTGSPTHPLTHALTHSWLGRAILLP